MKLCWATTTCLLLSSSTVTTAFLPAASTVRTTHPLFAAQTGDDFQPSQRRSGVAGMSSTSPQQQQQQQPQTFDPRIRQAYAEWCKAFNKPYEEGRLAIFGANFQRMERYAQQTGEQVKFNEYADLTTDEYRKLLQEQGRSPRRQPIKLSSSIPEPSNIVTKKIAENNFRQYESLSRFLSYFQTALTGAVIGGLAVLPAQALHYLYIQDYTYTTYAQWEWDWIASVIQAALFANVYRFAVRQDVVENEILTSRLVWSLVFIKSLVRVTVTPDCAAFTWLLCAEPYYMVNDSMLSTLLINTLESFTLFAPVANIMQKFLANGSIPTYDGDEGQDDDDAEEYYE
mmetsp:Transcript_113626/g.328113  ORF Transcript_113626/g.328113 Transcript_113626/m.328113 type:complete len:342 (-) Transcript_113626:77-1102(-)